MNSYLMVSFDTTDDNTMTVKCSPGPSALGQSFECEFCYDSDSSCQNHLLTCHTLDSSSFTTSLTSLTEETYCYRATARINGISVAVTQDTFNYILRQQGQGIYMQCLDKS